MPGYYASTAGDVLTAANAISYWSRQVVIQCTSGTRPTAVEGMTIYETDNDCLCVYNGTAWVQITPEGATVATSETETSTSYDDMATSGPAVTVTTNTLALVTIGAFIQTSGAQIVYMSAAVSGATTVAAADARAHIATTTGVGYFYGAVKTSRQASLTAGANTFTAKYRVNGATGTIADRHINAVGLLV